MSKINCNNRGNSNIVRLHRKRKLLLMITNLLVATLHAEVVTDGTVGPGRTLTGPNYQIGQELGTRQGGNIVS